MSITYNLLEAHRTEKYVLKQYGHLSNTAWHLYTGLRFLEEMQKGFCCPVIATYRDIAKTSHVSRNAVGKGLLCLIEKGLVKGAIGSPVKDDKRATLLTRVSVDDLKRKSLDGDGIAQQLAVALSRRPFMFNGQTVSPNWSVGITGRVCSSKPNIQKNKGKELADGLCKGLPAGHTLEYADIKSADPTVIKHILGMPQNADLYGSFMRATGCDRTTAKRKVSMLQYVKNSQRVFNYWPEAARNDPTLSDYAQKLHDYKTDRFREAQKTRCVTTLTGRMITAEKEKRLHAGKVFSWKVQGTVADIVNRAALELIGMPGVKTIVPHHDALYVIRVGGTEGAVGKTLRAQAQKLGIQIQVETGCVSPPESCAASAIS